MRITNDNSYVRPKKTITDTLQNNEDLKDQLQNYIQLESYEELCYVKKGTHIKYITTQNGKKKFRLGGFLELIKPEYIVLKSSNGLTWCVQKKDTIFFRLMSHNEKVEEVLEEQQDVIEKQEKEIMALRKALNL